jgi:GTP cyclohydrolase I
VKQIPFVSVCNHHVIPFIGHAWVGYVPNGELAGLSKFARVVEHFARRLQVQEELTTDVHSYLEANLTPRGLAVRMEAEHLCMTIRGAQAPGVTTVTTKTSGVFADHSRTAKMEFLEAIK